MTVTRWRSGAARRAGAAFAILGAIAASACASRGPPGARAPSVRDGNATRGAALVASGAGGCTACHAIPDMRAPGGVVGPPLTGIAGRAFIAGQLPNKPDVLVAFLQDPPALVPATGMPDVRLSLDEARDIAAYLYTLGPPGAR